MLKTNYHTHTKRCGHAVGEDEEYVQAAIQAGIKVLGFSDHVPFHPSCQKERMDLEEYPNYLNSLKALKKKYENDITIYIGLEVEYYEEELDLLLQFRKELDYCILGQHNLTLDGKYTLDLTTPEELDVYFHLIEKACAMHLCDYIAHPDYALWSYPRIDGSVKALAKQFAKLSKYYQIPLELNCGSGVHKGMRTYEEGLRYPYPTRVFFEVFAEEKCPIIIGLDAHNPNDFLTEDFLNRSLSIVEGFNLHFLTDYDLIKDAKERKQKLASLF